MNNPSLHLSTSQRLQPFILQANSVEGIAISQVISDCISAPGVYVFTELMETPSVVKASERYYQVAPYYRLLRVFLYGDYKDYVAQKEMLPPLTPVQMTKLKHLTIVSLSESRKTLSYQLLKEYLDIPTTRELEDLIIDAFYNNVLRGKLDQRQQQLQVEGAMGRDQPIDKIRYSVQLLNAYSYSTSKLAHDLDKMVQIYQAGKLCHKKRMDQYHANLSATRRAVQREEDANIRQEMSKQKEKGGSSGRRDIVGEYNEYNYESQEYIERAGRSKKR
ncbi:hypothetical protein BDF14DRAFT_1720822 [Spinellus fusiger]|nr:hypothetical protein BDF14DRAFT_1907452 [Spinellus fusiger]KAI7870586.1 hypothetical protein BDF14DRAFT_1720822 [Spinellus fusiger]